MLIGINSATLQVRNVEAGDFCVKLSIRSKGDCFDWVFVSVYGTAKDAQKHAFLAKLARICEKESLPMLVGGDFNMIRKPEEKNNNNFNPRWSFMFNAIIERLNLKEIELTGRQYVG